MKKTLQINLGGLTFNIEEDAYTKLSGYLASIQKHFSSYESCDEIIQDIEGRIAEKFYEKTTAGGIIEMDDVDKIIKSMGSVSDFEAIQEDEDLSKPISGEKREEKTEEKGKVFENKKTDYKENNTRPNTKFYKDGKRKALGGVLSGLAHRFEMDVVWLRILFIVLAFGLIDHGVGPFFFIAYIACWIAFPERLDLEENVKIKKFYRNPDNKVLGGVATGLSQYLGIDLVIVRLLFVVTGFFAVGIFIYIIFWIVAPNAVTLTQKMEMKGQPVTLENIETSIKSNAMPREARQESALAKILLFPFRLLGIILKALGQLVRPIGSVIRVFAGVLLMILGACIAFAALIATGVFFGVVSNNDWISGEHFIGTITRDFPPVGGFFAFLCTFIPGVALTIVGLSLISDQRHGNRNFWLTTLALWFAGIVGMSVVGSKYAMNFSNTYKFGDEVVLANNPGVLYLDVLEEDLDDEVVIRFSSNVYLEASDDNTLLLERKFKAKGRTKEIASKNAKNILYEVTQKDSVLIFPDNIVLGGEVLLRGQEVDATLKIPLNKKFKMTERFAKRELRNSWKLTDKYGIRLSDVEKYTFHISENDEIICEDCPELTESEREALSNRGFDDDDFGFGGDFKDRGEHKKSIDVSSFDKLELGNNFIVYIKKGDSEIVEFYSNDEGELNDVEAEVSGHRLSIGFKDSFKNHDSRIHVYITTPNLNDVEISGAVVAKVIGFKDQNKMNIGLSGASKLAIDVESEILNVEASGASKLVFKGKVEKMNIDISGASSIDAKDIDINYADIDASGASVVNLGKTNHLKKDVSGGSRVERE